MIRFVKALGYIFGTIFMIANQALDDFLHESREEFRRWRQ